MDAYPSLAQVSVPLLVQREEPGAAEKPWSRLGAQALEPKARRLVGTAGHCGGGA